LGSFRNGSSFKHPGLNWKMSVDKAAPVAIVGAGAWGLSTALHLTNAGYTNITIFEQASTIPSRYSGAYDLNKIVRAEYEDEFYTNLALVSLQAAKHENRADLH
jgi:sarcosine oxidase / L-pipecolate oxidase